MSGKPSSTRFFEICHGWYWQTDEMMLSIQGMTSSSYSSRMAMMSSLSNVISFGVQFLMIPLQLLNLSNVKMEGIPGIIDILGAQMFAIYIALGSAFPFEFSIEHCGYHHG